MMKKRIALIALCMSVAVGCDGLLDVEPQNSIQASTALTNVGGVTALLNNVYAQLRPAGIYGRQLILEPDLLADNTRIVAGGSGRGNGESINARGSHITFWEAYTTINNANLVLESADRVTDGTPAQIAQLKGRAIFVRGLLYFNLARNYGYNPNHVLNGFDLGVPIVTTAVDEQTKITYPSRATTEEVFAQAEADLLASIEYFTQSGAPNANAPFYGTKAAAHAILSRLYLYWAGNTANADKLNKSITHTDAALAENVGQFVTGSNWVANWRARSKLESIFEINYVAASENVNQDNSIQGWTNRDPARPTIGWGDVLPSNKLLASYEAHDVRLGILVPFTRNTGEVVQQMTKFFGTGGTYGLDNVPVIRVSELYLNRAEAYARLGNTAAAQTDLNRLRTRAGLDAITPTGTELMDEIILERNRELAFEGHRFYDFTRRGLDVPKQDGTVLPFTDYRILPPLPAGELIINPNLVNNPEY